MKTYRRYVTVALLVALSAGAWQYFGTGSVAEDKVAKGKAAKSDPAVERTRKQVRMLDDVYKSAVVLITEHYVKDKDSLPAGSAAIALFDAVKKKGWHEVRLLDATGIPYEAKNAAKDDFEKAAVAALRNGKDYHEQIIEKKGERYLRAATPVPVVLKKCVMCHDHYKDAKPGEAIGALSYTIKIE